MKQKYKLYDICGELCEDEFSYIDLENKILYLYGLECPIFRVTQIYEREYDKEEDIYAIYLIHFSIPEKESNFFEEFLIRIKNEK